MRFTWGEGRLHAFYLGRRPLAGIPSRQPPTRATRQISHAIPPRHESTQPQKPQNINDQIAKFEICSRELHAKFLEITRPAATTSPPPNRGIYAIQASDTPATHRQRASHGAKPPPTPSHQHVTLHIPRARWNARPSPLTELSEKGDASQCAAQQEPSLLSTRSGHSHTRTRPRGARHCRESEVETGGERSCGRVHLHRMFHRSER